MCLAELISNLLVASLLLIVDLTCLVEARSHAVLKSQLLHLFSHLVNFCLDAPLAQSYLSDLLVNLILVLLSDLIFRAKL